MIAYKQITIRDPEYAAEKDLRNRALRLPLGLLLTENDLRGEDAQIHWVAVDETGKVVGCVLMVNPGDGTAHVRQMAIAESLRGQGIGAGLMAQVEKTARKTGADKITMHARLSARGFYERLGYQAVSEDVFTEVTIPHIQMEKKLDRENP